MANYASILPLLIVVAMIQLYSGVAIILKVENNCDYTVWPVIITTNGASSNINVSNGFSLLRNDSKVINIQPGWSGRLWGRTLCTTNTSTGNFSCLTGDCGTGKIACQGMSYTSPVNFIDLNTSQNGSQDFYNANVAAGYNLAVTMVPQGSNGSRCALTGCVFDYDYGCPNDHRVITNGSVIGCRSSCDAFHTNESCCTNVNDCERNSFSAGSLIFKKGCPRAYHYALDVANSTFVCPSPQTSYTVTFCPSPSLARVVCEPFQSLSTSLSPTSTTSLSKSDVKRKRTILLVSLPILAATSIMLLCGVWTSMRKRKATKISNCLEVCEIKNAVIDSLQFDLNTIRTATNNFAAENKLGEGGFGEVYKGKPENGQEIAVKRLSKNSGQGAVEFKNEVVLAAKLRHKNLVKLLGFCVATEEKILVYEFLSNSSLDKFIFDQKKQSSLNWQIRCNIIVGIARGLLYLHEDSPLKVIHRDLKSSNILLDEHMNPKISDFGLAKLFGVDQIQGDTKRIIGTYGYMAPEYAITGHYSVKSDVYSFGVLVLEIVSGQRNRFCKQLQLEEALLHRAWRLWNENRTLYFVDTTLKNDFPIDEVTKCIHIALLCIQDDAALRPRMSSIVAALNGQAVCLPTPKPPNYFGTNILEDNDSLGSVYTGNKTITNLYPRDFISKSVNVDKLWRSNCPNNTMFANSSQYEANLNTLFGYLSGNATNLAGFYEAVSNNGNTSSETIYGNFLCQGDLDPRLCYDCVIAATTKDFPMTRCPNRKVAILWYEGCMVRYSNQSFFGKLDEMPADQMLSGDDVQGNITHYTELVNNMMSVIANRAPFDGSQKKFATYITNFTAFGTLYGLGQCTPDLSPNDCTSYIRSLVYHRNPLHLHENLQQVIQAAWKQRNDGAPLEFVDPNIRDSCSRSCHQKARACRTFRGPNSRTVIVGIRAEAQTSSQATRVGTKDGYTKMEFVEERLAWLEEKADKWAELQVIVHEQAEQIVKLMADRDALREQLQFVQGKADEALEKCATLTRAVGRDALGVGAAKIKPPKPRDYSGARDAKEVDNFLFDMEQYFRICQLSDDQKVDTAIMYLFEDAKLWWRTKHADIEAGRIKIDTWAEFKEELKNNSTPSTQHMNEKDRVFNFVNGLKEWAQREILRQNIDTLAAAMCAAERLIDYSVGKGRQSEKDSSGTSTRSNSPSPSSPKGTENGSRVSSNTINTYHRRSGGGDAQRQTSTPSHNSGNSRAGASSENTREINCILCRGPHKWWDCEHKEELDKIQKRLSSMSVQEATKETSSDEEPTYRMGSIRRLSAMRMIAPQEEPEVRYLSAMRVMEPEKKATSKKQARTRNLEKREMKPMELATSQIHSRQNQNQSQESLPNQDYTFFIKIIIIIILYTMNLATNSKLVIIINLLLQLISKSTSTPTYLYSICSNITEFTTNSKYHTNLNTLFKSLSSNATNNPTGFDITSAGTNTSDAIYGLFLCRGDLNITTCRDCVKTATTTDLPKTYCPNRKIAVIWYDECTVRYSNESLLGKMEQSPKVFLTNTQNVTGNQTAFSDLIGNTMNSLLAQTSNSKSGKKYATKVAKFDSLRTLYAMEQCTPDLSAADCNQCLTIAIESLDFKRGARVMQPSCFVRYEIYPFYDGAINISSPPLPSPSPSPGKATTITIVNNCSYTVWPGISTISSSVKVPTGFTLLNGESKTINIQSNWEGSIWGRTNCSLDHKGNFSCETGDCGTGKIECQTTSSPNLVTMAGFSISQIEDQYKYNISVEAGYNLPMMATPEGVIGLRCVVTGCVFNLDNSICPPSMSVVNKNLRMIGCRNPCYDAKQCCKTWPKCLSSDYVESSNLFGKSCPRASNNPSDLINTTFSCLSYKTSYKVTFCPSPNMASLFSTPFQTVQEPSSLSAPSPSGKNKTYVTKVVVAIVVPIVVLTLLIASCTSYARWKVMKSLSIDIQNVLEDFTTAESLVYEFSTLQAATNYFSDDQMLGGGGFGNVYKGTLPNGQDIAVKRLSRVSNQGMESFKNEAVLIAKLQHKNLVKLLGFCLTREEKLLVYEYVPNKSLNYFLFDPKKQGELDWPTRYNIITGIARGILYLHEDSRPRIVHRDLKAANILLEEDMNPKIADFGLARIFKVEQTEDDTNIVAGTYGYMAPEYAMNGQFSVKSDVYGFGVLVLEIVSGKKINSKFHPSGVGDLLTHAWRSLKEETTLNFMDPTLKDTYSADEVMRSIHLGLLCVQENAHERPTMSTIVFMLNTNSTTSTLPTPQRPRFYYNSSTEPSYIMTRSNKNSTATSSTSCDSKPYTQNQVTISEMSPR
ncbi:uncharacterized protein LOC110731175 [Chenopodium quinoa]|uniref:uncharacterized protein LOC110731175 n=1 Tax=Chenopodium quinoa TaxID=63459 RepID=UPI000B78D995|nr:uncharacterized protein LOC110731175 [Chenopodium quinoa]